ncbi:MAG: hypothetical protein MUF43_11900 [Flavobacterium sp.]|jgi:hypothetical protein|nr:hypothetical protein [Flavobacterium sp.]
METKKMSLDNIQGKLSRAEMKNIMAGAESEGGTCKSKYDTGCSVSGHGNAEDKCCQGLVCEMNGTGTGTICM